ncbi:hypothetical protein llap_22600 [Limosa lapponica baueri]|uniref:Uncharacterized protein n=1 Tax=Limosa lapponica baueri TaxID=1758121 RepID=A0A2I0SZW8_LIMLA|nr:hypothetical protein llap_22600 [Limosa lapponica baueri]
MDPAAFIAFSAFVGSLVAFLVYCFLVTMGWTQGGTPQKCRDKKCRGKKGNDRGVQPLGKDFVLLQPLQPSRNHCPTHPEINNINEIPQELNSSTRNLTRLPDT